MASEHEASGWGWGGAALPALGTGGHASVIGHLPDLTSRRAPPILSVQASLTVCVASQHPRRCLMEMSGQLRLWLSPADPDAAAKSKSASDGLRVGAGAQASGEYIYSCRKGEGGQGLLLTHPLR